MQDNFTPDSIIEQLIKYIDGELSPEQNKATELLLQTDSAVKDRYENLLAARDAIRLKGIQQKIKTLHRQYYPLANADVDVKKNEPAKNIRPTFSNRFKSVASIAAILIVMVGGFILYQFSTTTNESVYADNFISYQLPVLRGENNLDNVDSLFNDGNYPAVIKIMETKQPLTQKNLFLIAVSYLQTGDTGAAIKSLLALQKMNNDSTEKFFADEADYYLTLAYIKEGNIDAAKTTLAKITSDPHHMYYLNGKKISTTSLSILKMKK